MCKITIYPGFHFEEGHSQSMKEILNVVTRLTSIMGEPEEATGYGEAGRVELHAMAYPENISPLTSTTEKGNQM
jgi:hypothetical protein